MGKTYAYFRVSTNEQNAARQLELMKDIEFDESFLEAASGKDMDRPLLQELLSKVERGDTIIVTDYTRIARNAIDLMNLVQDLEDKGVVLKSLKEQFDTSTTFGKMFVAQLGFMAQIERENILERQAQGIKLAKEQGKYKGRQPSPLPNNWERNYKSWKQNLITKVQFAENVKMSRTTLDKKLFKYEIEKIYLPRYNELKEMPADRTRDKLRNSMLSEMESRFKCFVIGKEEVERYENNHPEVTDLYRKLTSLPTSAEV